MFSECITGAFANVLAWATKQGRLLSQAGHFYIDPTLFSVNIISIHLHRSHHKAGMLILYTHPSPDSFPCILYTLLQSHLAALP